MFCPIYAFVRHMSCPCEIACTVLCVVGVFGTCNSVPNPFVGIQISMVSCVCL
eukprot:m.79872 g.79872  ORF g.79872 m.79872 type:complete len:53 (+) comp12582_c1_seq1:2564-2722(+)